MTMRSLLLPFLAFPVAKGASSSIVIEDFTSASKLEWSEMNDPVMGGRSKGTFTIEDGVGRFVGEVVDVPSLSAPGFITTNGRGNFPDVSSCQALKLELRSATDYAGYRISFGLARPPHAFPYTHGYKTHFNTTKVSSGEFESITIPFTDFSDKWSEYTGDVTVTCEDNSDFCPDKGTLKNMKEIVFWGEGVAGKIDMSISKISAIYCDAEVEAKMESKSPARLEAVGDKSPLSGYVLALAGLGGAGVALVLSEGVTRYRSRTKYSEISGEDQGEVLEMELA